MAKDDYLAIVFRVLTYYYAIIKRKVYYDENVFREKVLGSIDDEYATNVLKIMQDEGLIKGINFTKAWGNNYIPLNSTCEISITGEGMRYLAENSTMQQFINTLKGVTGIIGDLVRLVF